MVRKMLTCRCFTLQGRGTSIASMAVVTILSTPRLGGGVMTARVLGISTLAVVLAASVAGAQDGYRSGYVRTVEQGVTLQRASEAASEAAVTNLPFLPGDRVWTDDVGRLEIVFSDGSTLRLDSRSKLDFVSQEGGRRSERVVLRLWSGSVILHYRDDDQRSPEFTIETPEGVIEARKGGIYRLDVDPGQARVAVIEGEAGVEAEGHTRVSDGQQVVIREGRVEGGPERADRSVNDDFARWDGDLQEQLAYAGDDRYLPQEVAPYGADFAANGRWDTLPEYGNVWYPTVDVGWQPYTHGHWAWTSFGWTWVPNERWGWATSHYGRWGHGSRGWYWIPGSRWGPGWVSWSTGGDFVGWCPLGWGDRPVRGFRGPHHRDRGRAVPRGGVLAADADRSAWTYLRRTDMGQRDVARRRVNGLPAGMTQTHASPVARQRLSRDLRVVDALDNGARPSGAGAERAVPRNVRTRPGMGDTVPELRGDNLTTIPHPTARRRYESEREREDDRSSSSRTGASGATRRQYPDSAAAPRRDSGETNDAPGEAGRVRGGGTDRSRETVRPLFAPLSRTRSDDGTRDGTARDGAGRDDSAARERRERERESFTRTRPSGDDGTARRRSGDSDSRDSGARERPGFRPQRQDDSGRERGGFRSEPRSERRDDGGRSRGDSGGSRGSSGGDRGGDRARPRERPN
jgi:hypothetical protein